MILRNECIFDGLRYYYDYKKKEHIHISGLIVGDYTKKSKINMRNLKPPDYGFVEAEFTENCLIAFSYKFPNSKFHIQTPQEIYTEKKNKPFSLTSTLCRSDKKSDTIT